MEVICSVQGQMASVVRRAGGGRDAEADSRGSGRDQLAIEGVR